MVKNYPKNTGHAQSAAATTTALSTAMITTALSDITLSTATQTRAQIIQALEDAMTKEEHGAYLDVCDMGEDFCSAEF